MRRLVIEVSTDWPEGESLDDHEARGRIATEMKQMRGILTGYPTIDVSEPHIIVTPPDQPPRASRSDKGKPRKKAVTAVTTDPVLATDGNGELRIVPRR